MKFENKHFQIYYFVFILCFGMTYIGAIFGKCAYADSSTETKATAKDAAISDSFGWSSGGPYGGYIYDLATADSNKNILYAGTDHGLYGSVDTGRTWKSVGLSQLQVTKVAVDPQNAQMIYAGTAEGIKRSVNGGASWVSIGPYDGSTGEAHHIQDIAISSQNSSVIYTVTYIGPGPYNYNTTFYLLKSTDGGNSWETKLTKKEGRSIKCILIDTIDHNRIYVGVGEWEIALYLSDNGGDTWTSKSFPTGYSSFEEVIALEMTPSGIDPVRIYALTRFYGLFVSLNQGKTWTKIDTPYIHANPPWALTVDPVDPYMVYVATKKWNHDLDYYEPLLHKSTNAGASWATSILSGLATGFAWSQDYQLYASFDTGVQRSSDQGLTWHRRNKGIAITPISGIAFDPSSNKIFAVINERFPIHTNNFDSYHMAVSANEGLTWNFIEKGPKNLGAVTVVPGNPSIIWTGDGYQSSSRYHVYNSNDAGNSWSKIFFLQIIGSIKRNGASNILVHRRNNQCVLVGFQHHTGKGILARTTDGGNTWSKLAESTSALASDPNNPDMVYRGRYMEGGLWQISNVCGNWHSVNIAAHKDIGDVLDIEVGSNSKVYIAASYGLWSWYNSKLVKIARFPKGIPTALAIDRNGSHDILYVGTKEDGIFSSNDGGLNWISLNKGLGNLEIRKLALSTGPTKRLYAGTTKGVWRTNVKGDHPDPPEPPDPTTHILPGVLMLLLDD